MTPTETSIARRTDAWWHSNARTGRFGSLLGRSLEIHFGSKQTSLPRRRPARSKQRSVLLQPMCTEPNRGLFCFSLCARGQTEVCFASADVRDPKQRSVCFSRCARAKQRSVWLQRLCLDGIRSLASGKTTSIHPPFLSILTVTHIVRASAVSLTFTQHPIT